MEMSLIQSGGLDLIGLMILIGLIVFAFVMFKRKSSYSNPMMDFLYPSKVLTIKELNNQLIDFYDKIFNRYVDFYRKLDRIKRKKFIDRSHEFIQKMNFIGRDGQEINLKVCALCAAPAIQISLGLDTYLFNSYHTIVVYPKQFYSETQKAFVKGGVSRGDVIFFSLEDLIKGYENPNDALNLGLHEMAHAIHIEYFDQKFEARFPRWEKIAIEEVAKLRYEKDPVLRNYAGQNKHELFAVCIETFFEQPNELKAQTPLLYDAMADLLNQRPY